jgi:hypothetical protein
LERLVILMVRRGDRAFPMHAGRKLQKGDRAEIAVHVPDRDEAYEWLAAAGWEPSPEGEVDASS